MKQSSEPASYTFAIVGLGPRGGYALECLACELASHGTQHTVRILVFDTTGEAGNSPVYTDDQLDSNWINITERALRLDERLPIEIGSMQAPRFPSYHDWAGLEFADWPEDSVDTFPPRAQIGKYLRERCNSLIEPLAEDGILEFIGERVDRVTQTDNHCGLVTRSGASYQANEVLLTVGHQPVHRDDQIEHWRKFVQRSTGNMLYDEPYPVTNLKLQKDESGIHRAAVRGYGLAMIDVVRGLAERYGEFVITDEATREQRYEPGAARLKIAPFSRDGLTMGPKPVIPALDSLYRPSDTSIRNLEARLRDREAQAAADGHQFLIEIMAPLIAEQYISLRGRVERASESETGIEDLVISWLLDDEYDDARIMSRELDPVVTLDRFIGMAIGEAAVYLDYCAGQVWRHAQPTIYASLSHSELSNEALAEIISLDERMKRYAFGPPVESLQQLKALHEASVLDLRVLNDPEIVCDERGWTLTCGEKAFTTPTMIDSVLDGPKIKTVSSPIIENLLSDERIQIAHDELGVMTNECGYIRASTGDEVLPIAMLGRLAKGTVIGVDAILECFGERPRRWAEAAVSRCL